MSRMAWGAGILVALSIIAWLPRAAAAQGTRASPALIERVRSTTTNERGEYRIVELRPRIFHTARGTYRFNFDVYSLFNSSVVLWVNSTYGVNWLSPTSTLAARLIKFGMQYDF